MLVLTCIFHCSQYLTDILASSCYKFLSASLCRFSCSLLPVINLFIPDITLFDVDGKWTYLSEIEILVTVKFQEEKKFICFDRASNPCCCGCGSVLQPPVPPSTHHHTPIIQRIIVVFVTRSEYSMDNEGHNMWLAQCIQFSYRLTLHVFPGTWHL